MDNVKLTSQPPNDQKNKAASSGLVQRLVV